jgi:Holliday junction resolvase
MNSKAKGAKNERRAMRLLEADGYRCTRAAASLGLFDVLGVGKDDLVLVQVKSNEWPRTDEMQQLRAFLCPANAKKLIHRWRDRAPLPDVRIL